MHTHHVDEISVWSWIAAWVFALIALAAILFGPQPYMKVGFNAPPISEPALVPPPAIPDPRA
jgi:hypothetical protein